MAEENMDGIEAALAAFKKAESGGMNISELAGILRGIMAGRDEKDGGGMWRELREFVDLDLSDFAYSLAIHDQAAMDGTRAMIKKWVPRLEEAGRSRR